MSNKRSLYSKLATSEETPLFTVTPGKNCRMYPYLWSEECAQFYGPTGNPKDNPFRCNAMGSVDSGQAYLGYPINFQYNLAGNPNRCGESPAEYPSIIGQQQLFPQSQHENFKRVNLGSGSSFGEYLKTGQQNPTL